MKKILILSLLIFISVAVLGQSNTAKSENGKIYITSISGNAEVYYDQKLKAITVNRADEDLMIEIIDIYYTSVTKATTVLKSWGWNEDRGIYTSPDGNRQAMILLEILSGHPKIALSLTVKGRKKFGLKTRHSE